MPVFFVKREQIANDRIYIKDEDAAHMRVLRHKVGDAIPVSDGEGLRYDCRIDAILEQQIELKIIKKSISESEPLVKISIFQGMPKNDKMEMVIQKCVELGAFEIIPVITEHTVVKLKDNSSKKTERFQKIAEAAAKQCERGIIPAVSEAVSFTRALEMMKGLDEAYVAYEREKQTRAVDAFMNSEGMHIGVFIGPEGGFSKAEIEQCVRNNTLPISLGKRILRTETAGFMTIITLLLCREELRGENTSFFSK